MVNEGPQTMAVMVTNENRFPIRDRFDGREYVFMPDFPTEVPIDAANHIFGWFPKWEDEEGRVHEPDPVKMRMQMQRRWGWNTPEMHDKAEIFSDKIKIRPVVYRMVPVDDEEVNQETVKPMLQAPAKRPNKLMQAADEAARRTQII